MIWLFTTIIYQPLLNVIVLLYGLAAQDLGIAIVLMTLLIRALSLPLSMRMLRSQREMALLGPEMERLKSLHKDDKTKQGQAMMELYKQHNINPLAGCLPLIVQIPVLLGLYRVFLNIFKPESLELLYALVPNPGIIETVSLGFIDLASRSVVLALMAGAAQFVHAKLSQTGQQTGQAAMLGKQMMYFFPIMIIVISWNLPAGLALYWVVSTLLSIGEQWYVQRTMHHVQPAA